MDRVNKKHKNSSDNNKVSADVKTELSANQKQKLVEELEKLKSREEELDKEIAKLESQGVDIDLRPQMEALHEYNQMKDVTQMVLGYIADIEQVSVRELHKRFNLPTD